MKRSFSLLVVAGLLLAACGTSGPGRLEFGVQRLALDLAFVDETAAPPLEAEVIIRLIPAPPQILEPTFDLDRVRVRPDEPPPELPDLEPPPELCPSAPPEATVLITAAPSVLDPPVPGSYLRSNAGTIEVVGAGLPLRFPYPFMSAWRVSEEAEVTRPGPLGTPVTDVIGRQFTVTKSLGTIEVIETFELSDEALLLIERRTISNGGETIFRTDPPVEFFHFGAVGDDWTSAGADLVNDIGVVIQGSITDREIIDVCGDLIDTFVINYTEQVVNLVTGETSGTKADVPSVINLATQYGGLVVREDMHTTQRVTDDEGTTAVVNFDYVSTLLSIDPNL
jgi:hypothetical protein